MSAGCPAGEIYEVFRHDGQHKRIQSIIHGLPRSTGHENIRKPTGISDYKELRQALPKDFRGSLPMIEKPF